MNPLWRVGITAFLQFVACASIAAQAQWSQRHDLTSRSQSDAVYDQAHGYTILFGGDDGVPRDDCWVWDGSTWTELSPAHRPSARRRHVMAYDSLRQRVVLFGGETPNPPPSSQAHTTFDTWAWDGADWTEIVTAHAPGSLLDSAMVYDAARDRVMLWGGTSGGSYGQVWEFDGTDWAQVPTQGPNWPQWVTPLAMVYDPSTATTALFRGPGSNGGLWRWNGTSWTQQVGPSFSSLSGYRLAFDAAQQRLLLVAGQSFGSAAPPTVYAWQASDFSWQPLTADGPYSFQPIVVFDTARARLVFVGASRPGTSLDSSVWEWDGVQWQRRSWAPPGARYGHTAATDTVHDRTFVFGGLNGSLTDLWVREEGRWDLRIPKPSFTLPGQHPSTSSGNRLVYDEARDAVLLVGGADSVFELWRANGSQWQKITAAGPTGRHDVGVVYDRQRERVVMFGGVAASSPSSKLDDMWAWDGTAWTELHPTFRPHPRAAPGMAYDARRDRIVLLGGQQSGGATNDTWEFDGQNWQVFSGGALPGSTVVSMAYDLARQAVVAHLYVYNQPQQVWQWDGIAWTQIAVITTPQANQPVLVGAPDGIHLLGGTLPGFVGSPALNATEWLLRTPFVADLESFGEASVSPLGPLVLHGTGAQPWLGETCRLAYGPLPGLPLPGLWFGAARLQPTVDLGWLGWPGRSVLISLDAPLPAVNDGHGGAIADIAIPYEPSFLGTAIHCQGFVFEPLTGELTTSNGVTLTFGAR